MVVNDSVRLKIRHFLTVNKLKQKELAELCGVHSSTISGILGQDKRKNRVSLKIFDKVCEVMSISINDLFGNKTFNSPVYSGSDTLTDNGTKVTKTMNRLSSVILNINPAFTTDRIKAFNNLVESGWDKEKARQIVGLEHCKFCKGTGYETNNTNNV